ELEKWTETEAAGGGSTAGPGRCLTWSAPIAESRRRSRSNPMARDPSTAKIALRSGARGGSRTEEGSNIETLSGPPARVRPGRFFLSYPVSGTPNVQIARPRSVHRG